jgi:hypothetical protein
MSNTLYAILLVSSTNQALRVEKLLQTAGIACKLIPVPRQISSDCGVCVRVHRDEGETAHQVLASAGLEILGTVPI